jgi:hypothetical protein
MLLIYSYSSQVGNLIFWKLGFFMSRMLSTDVLIVPTLRVVIQRAYTLNFHSSCLKCVVYSKGNMLRILPCIEL